MSSRLTCWHVSQITSPRSNKWSWKSLKTDMRKYSNGINTYGIVLIYFQLWVERICVLQHRQVWSITGHCKSAKRPPFLWKTRALVDRQQKIAPRWRGKIVPSYSACTKKKWPDRIWHVSLSNPKEPHSGTYHFNFAMGFCLLLTREKYVEWHVSQILIFQIGSVNERRSRTRQAQSDWLCAVEEIQAWRAGLEHLVWPRPSWYVLALAIKGNLI